MSGDPKTPNAGNEPGGAGPAVASNSAGTEGAADASANPGIAPGIAGDNGNAAPSTAQSAPAAPTSPDRSLPATAGAAALASAAPGTPPVAQPPTQPPTQPPAAPPARRMPPPPSPERRWPVGGAMALGILALIILVGGFGGWATMSRIAGAVVAPGQVEVEQQRQVVQHPEGGVVSEILVREGQAVAAGQVLIQLDGALLHTELTIVEGQYFEMLARRGRLEAERADASTLSFPEELRRIARDHPEEQALMDGQQSLFDSRRDTLAKSLEQLDQQAEQVRQQISGVDALLAALDQQRDLIGQELRDQRSLLAKGLAQTPRVLALEREAANLDGQRGEATATRAQGETRLTEIGINKLRQQAERRESAETDLRDLGYRELELAERRRALTEKVARLEITAPVAGIVYQMKVTTPRSVIQAAEPVLYIIPQDRPLIIAARIPPNNIDEVNIGQEVKLRFSAFSGRTTPEIDGLLEQVSADAVTDPVTQAQFYRAEVTIPEEQRHKLGDLLLIPGMPVEVYIQTGERSPLAYLLKPLTDYFSRAMREK